MRPLEFQMAHGGLITVSPEAIEAVTKHDDGITSLLIGGKWIEVTASYKDAVAARWTPLPTPLWRSRNG